MTNDIKTMLDPSLFSDNSYESTFRMVEEHNNEMSFYVSHSFYELLSEDELIEESSVRDYFSAYSSFYRYEELKGKIDQFEISPFRAKDFIDDYSTIYDSIAKSTTKGRYAREYGQGTRLNDILFEEFIFSLRNSPILSRLKKISNDFMESVAYAITISENQLDRNWNAIKQEVGEGIESFEQVRQNLEKNAEARLDDEPVILSTYLRQIVKDYAPNWIIHVSKSYISNLVGALIGWYIGGPVGGAAGALSGPAVEDFVMFLADP